MLLEEEIKHGSLLKADVGVGERHDAGRSALCLFFPTPLAQGPLRYCDCLTLWEDKVARIEPTFLEK